MVVGTLHKFTQSIGHFLLQIQEDVSLRSSVVVVVLMLVSRKVTVKLVHFSFSRPKFFDLHLPMIIYILLLLLLG